MKAILKDKELKHHLRLSSYFEQYSIATNKSHLLWFKPGIKL